MPSPRSIAIGIALVVGSSCSHRADAPASMHSAVSPREEASTAAHDVRAYIDPITGELRQPTAAEAAAEIAKEKTAGHESKSATRPKEVRLPDGTIEVEVGPAAQQSMQGCLQSAGDVKIDHDCTPAVTAAP